MNFSNLLPNILIAVLALAAVLGLLLLAGRVARLVRLNPNLAGRLGGSGERLALVQTLALDTRRRAHLLRCDGYHVLLLTGGTADVVAGWLPATPEDAP